MNDRLETKTPETRKGKTLVLGMGNTLVSDDGVGIHAARIVEHMLDGRSDVDVQSTFGGGMHIMLLLEDYENAIIIDAVRTENGRPGTVYRMELDRLASTLHFTSPHSTNVYTAVELGRRCGLKMPSRVNIVAVEVEDTENVRESCTPRVEAAAPKAAEAAVSMIDGNDC